MKKISHRGHVIMRTQSFFLSSVLSVSSVAKKQEEINEKDNFFCIDISINFNVLFFPVIGRGK